jgi:hypothetical protein
MSDLIAIGTKLLAIWQWFVSPSVIPYAGAVAAIVAAFSLQPRAWITAPMRACRWGIQAALVWLVAASLLSLIGGGGNGSHDGQQTGSSPAQSEDKNSVTGPGGDMGGPSQGVLVVRFIAQPGDSTQAVPFACVLEMEGSEPVAIRTSAMDLLQAKVQKALEDHRASTSFSLARAVIVREPFPGDPCLQTIESTVRSVMPGIRIDQVTRATAPSQDNGR